MSLPFSCRLCAPAGRRAPAARGSVPLLPVPDVLQVLRVHVVREEAPAAGDDAPQGGADQRDRCEGPGTDHAGFEGTLGSVGVEADRKPDGLAPVEVQLRPHAPALPQQRGPRGERPQVGLQGARAEALHVLDPRLEVALRHEDARQVLLGDVEVAELLRPRHAVQDPEGEAGAELDGAGPQLLLAALRDVRGVQGDHHGVPRRVGEVVEGAVVEHPDAGEAVPLDPLLDGLGVIQGACEEVNGRGRRRRGLPAGPLLLPRREHGQRRAGGGVDALGEQVLHTRADGENVPIHPLLGRRGEPGVAGRPGGGDEDGEGLVRERLGDVRVAAELAPQRRPRHPVCVLDEHVLRPEVPVVQRLRARVDREELDRRVALHIEARAQGLVVRAVDMGEVHLDPLLEHLVRRGRELGEDPLAHLAPADVEHHEAWPLLRLLPLDVRVEGVLGQRCRIPVVSRIDRIAAGPEQIAATAARSHLARCHAAILLRAVASRLGRGSQNRAAGLE
eukprot:CAMPEP_0179242216 /NCGR_PEP_ID=MMETSP0797-20121207/16902_1 /TAXON_ID=47934 /ORGANISM="Dinophysis acuminata, Strain DAEP01" /LENGTH=503 /DNA_ID=CAMNT_0020949643 /DNA_START=19 /DNA_END=1528 /DNA_ORIENTATION=+